MKTRLLITGLLLGAFCLGTSMSQAETAVGDQVPDFELVGSDGKTYSAKQFKGKKAFVIAWYPKAFTGG
jgi:peroxiredoxin Q/BCP|tara:strand:+ start:1425 stop:1631 length:207 start_codon:yes stop_codon:yes gene_type:complete